MSNLIKVMLVEDEVYMTRMDLLLKAHDFKVLLFENELEARRAIDSGQSYDIALIDRSLPGSEENCGDELVKYSKEINPSIPVISISGYNLKADGADVHYTKAGILGPEWLIKKIKELINR